VADSFSGTHPFRPACLLARLNEDMEVDMAREDELFLLDDEGVVARPNELARALIEMIKRSVCPRCAGPLPNECAAAGSRVTRCRCIPICSRCGTEEAFLLMSPWQWPLSSEDQEDILETIRGQMKPAILDIAGEVVFTDGAHSPLQSRPHPGGWAEYG
jgi:hypothetical protein